MSVAVLPGLDHHSELHHSQTLCVTTSLSARLDHHSELHHSQTSQRILLISSTSLTTIQNYITLKQSGDSAVIGESLTTIQNYITLKHVGLIVMPNGGLDHHSELHHSQTQSCTLRRQHLLDHHSELHHSQTTNNACAHILKLDHHSELHHSQTDSCNGTVPWIA